MIPFLDLYGFLSVILRALTLTFEALVIGGVIFRFAIAGNRDKNVAASVTKLVISSALLLLLTELVCVAANLAVLKLSTNLAWADLRGAGFFVWGAVATIGAGLCLASAETRYTNVLSAAGCAMVLAGSVMTSHSAARVDHRAILIAMTAAHQLAGATWIGGMPYLLLALRRTDTSLSGIILRRFSTAATISVGVLLSAGVVMSRLYVGSVDALTGTSYGIMLLSKASLTAMVLLLGWMNLRVVRETRRGGAPPLLRLRRFAEVEAGIGITIILAAASLTSSPPAKDVQTDRASANEIEERLMPRWPRMRTPAFSELSPATPLRGATLLSGTFIPGEKVHKATPADTAWSEYNHHWAGLVMLTIGFFSILARRWSWARAWPLAFLGLAIFLFIRADSENWPLGPRGFWESFQVAEVATHRLFVLLIVIFSIFEWRVQTARSGHGAGLVFPIVCAAGGALLLTHSHSLGNAKAEFLAELSHLPLAILAVMAGWSRWLQVRLPRAPSVLGWVYPACFALIGAILLNYRET